MRAARRGRRWMFVAVLAALLWAGTVTCAFALSISVPSDTATTADVGIVLGPADATGTLTLFIDGRSAVTTTDVSADTTLTAVPLTVGTHHLRAELRPETGPATSTKTVTIYAWGVPGTPKWVNPVKKIVVSPIAVKAYAGASTASMTLRVDGVVVGHANCAPGKLVSFASVKLGKGPKVFEITEQSKFGDLAVFRRTAQRIQYEWSTMIVVDKSDFKLYWIRNDQLVKAYPIAHGRNNCTPCATWKILAKYKTDPHGVYGPRKMRLFRRVGSSGHYRYARTAYGIHGTNQPWVIGTMASHGCIRMYNRDVLQLWPQVKIGTMVVTRK
jgi:lipoprotein-anchoring transpeptidase ErfK/SrfK